MTARISLGDVAGSILDAKLPAGAAPILVRNKGAERKLEEAKKEEKERLELAKAKHALKESAHHEMKPKKSADAAVADPVRETMLRKVATRGVVALFNAVRTAQKDAPPKEAAGSKRKRHRETSADAAEDGSAGAASSAPDLSKDSFLDILRRGTVAQPGKRSTGAASTADGGQRAAEGGGVGGAPVASFLRDELMVGRNRAKDWEMEGDDDEDAEHLEDTRGVDGDDDDDDD